MELKWSDVPTKIDRILTDALKQFWPEDLPAATNDSYSCQRDLNPGSLGTSPLP